MIKYYCYNSDMFIALMNNDLGTTLFSQDGEMKCGDLIINPDYALAVEDAKEITPNEFYKNMKPANNWTEKEAKAFLVFKKSIAVYRQVTA